MGAPLIVVLVLISVLGAINLAVSISVIRSPFYSPFQKAAQCAIVWLIPLFGSVAVWAFLRSQHNWEKYDTRAFPEPSEKGVAIEIDHAIHENHGENGEVGGHD
jgi:hypothetical protein